MTKLKNSSKALISIFAIIFASLIGVLIYLNLFSEPKPPVITDRPYISYKYNVVGNYLNWTATDDNPTSYSIARNGTEITSGSWKSGSTISTNIDGLAKNYYEYSIVFEDASGYNATDTYLVHVIDIFNYGEALQKAIYFYLQQRSGDLPDDNPVIWRDDSCLNDGADVGEDLSGGYYDAGDHVKFALPMASTAATVAWTVYEYSEALTNLGLINETLDQIKWGTDYLIKCHTDTNEFYFQVGDGEKDHAYWASAEVIDLLYERESFVANTTQHATTPVAATAAALALTSIIFEDFDSAYADECLAHAEELYTFAYATQDDTYYEEIAGLYYHSYHGFWDELVAAAILLYIKTGNSAYLTSAESNVGNIVINEEEHMTHDWDNMAYLAYVFLAQNTTNPIYIHLIEDYLDSWLPSGDIPYTPGGLAFGGEWGVLRYSANTAFVASIWGTDDLCTPGKAQKYQTFTEKQIDYILGENPRKGSYMIGFGVNSPQNPHHRTAHGSWALSMAIPEKTQHILYGALVGGPGLDDSWDDIRTDYQKNEVACDYNSGLIGALTFLSDKYFDDVSTLLDFPNFTLEEQSSEIYASGRLDLPPTPDGELITNGDFSNGLNSWTCNAYDGEGAIADYSVVSDELYVDITSGGTSGDWNVQLIQGGLVIEEGMNYTISFLARADSPRNIKAILGEEGGDYTSYGEMDISLTTTMTKYSLSFIMEEETDEAARFQVNMGLDNVNVYLDNISVYERAGPGVLNIEGELLENGDFSDGLEGWSANFNEGGVGSYDASSGELLVDITNGGTDDWHVQLSQSPLLIKKNQNYTVSFYARADALNRSIKVLVGEVGDDYTAYGIEEYNLTTIMTYYEFTFTMTEDTDPLASFQINMGGNATSVNIFLDDISVYSYAEIVEGELLENGDFSDGLEGWSANFNEGGVGSYDASSGELLVDITNGGTDDWHVQLSQSPLKIRKGENYTVSFYARADALNRSIKVLVGEVGDDYTPYGIEEYNLTTTMTYYEFTFTMTENTDDAASFQINMGGNATSVNIFLDDIGVYSYAEPEVIIITGIEGELLSNGDFSDGTTGWGTGINTPAVGSYDASSGELFVDVTTAGTDGWHVQLLQGGLTIRQYENYTVSFYARAESSRDIEVIVGEEGGEYTSYGQGTYTLTTTMTLYTFTFNMTEETDTGARFQINMGLEAVSLYIDNISVYSHYYIEAEETFTPDEISTIINIRLNDHTTWPARVSDNLSYRYFFNISEVTAAGYNIGNITVDIISDVAVNLTGPILLSGDIYYIQIQYNNTLFFPGGTPYSSRQLQIRIGYAIDSEVNSTAWDPTNDFSYQGLDANWQETEYIPVYEDEILIYGFEP